MNNRSSAQMFVIAKLLILNMLLASCSPASTLAPPTRAASTTPILKPTLTFTPTIASTATFAITPTASSPLLGLLLTTWVSKAEIQGSEFRTFEEGLDSKVLMREFENLRRMFPENKGNLVIMTQRGDVGVINKKTNLIAFGQTLVGENGSAYTFLFTKEFSDSFNKTAFQSSTSDYIIYPNLIDNVQKEEILRVLGTLVDVMEGKLEVKNDLKNYKPKKAISFTQILATAKEIWDIGHVKDFSHIEDSSQDNIFNNYYKESQKSRRSFSELCNGKPEVYSRVVESNNRAYLSARFTSFCGVELDFSSENYSYIYLSQWGYNAIMEAYDSLWREVLLKYYYPTHREGFLLGSSPWYHFKSYPLYHVYDNYLPAHELTSGLPKLRNLPVTEYSKIDYFNFYITQVNIVNTSRLR